MSKVEELNKLALKLTGSNPYKKTIKESLESIATYLAGENVEVENIEDAIQKCTEYYSGGGGGGNRDWSAIGYAAEPEAIQDGYDYAVEILENWDSSITTMYNKYNNNVQLVYFPLVDTSNVTSMTNAFTNCPRLSVVPKFDMGRVRDVVGMFSYCKCLTKIDLDFSYAFSNTSNARKFV